MRDDLLKEQLMQYARTAADLAAQPDAAAIRRRARRHYQRVAVLTVTAVLLVAGLGVGLGLGLDRDGGTPTVTQPPPTPTVPIPTRPAPGPVPPTTRAAPATGRLPATFVGDLGGRVAVVSTATGRTVRTLAGSQPFGTEFYAVGISPDRATVYFSAGGPNPCAKPGVFRVPSAGGRPVRVVAGETAVGAIKVSADGSRLAYLAGPCPDTGARDVVVRDAAGAQVGRWPAAADLAVEQVSLSPDGRRLAVSASRNLQFLGVRVLDVARDRAIGDGRLLQAPDPGCDLVLADFQPRTGRLAGFERCIAGGLPRFRLVYLDPDGGRLLARGFAFVDRSGADLHVSTMDFDASGRHLLYVVSSADPTDYTLPDPPTGTWRSSGGDPPVRLQDERRPTGREAITTANPSW